MIAIPAFRLYHSYMRLFIAILFDDAVVDKLSRLRDSLHDVSSNGTFVPRSNLHLTLEFLGECSPAERNLAIDAMESISFSPFAVTMDRLGFFARPDGDIWWVGAREDNALMTLQENLHKALLSSGFSLERRKYRPHITLGRRVMTTACAGKIERIEADVKAIDLMLSERIDGQMVYTSLFASNAEQ